MELTEVERWQYHVEHSVPSLEDTLRATAENHYLNAVISMCHVHKTHGFGGVDVIDDHVAWPQGSVYQGVCFPAVCRNFLAELRAMPHREKLAAVPFLRRLGFGVTLFRAEDGALGSEESARLGVERGMSRQEIPFSLSFASFKLSIKIKRSKARTDVQSSRVRLGMIDLHATDPRSLRFRGLLRCAPKLLILARRAVERCNAPGGAGAAAAKKSFESKVDGIDEGKEGRATQGVVGSGVTIPAPLVLPKKEENRKGVVATKTMVLAAMVVLAMVVMAAMAVGKPLFVCHGYVPHYCVLCSDTQMVVRGKVIEL